MKGLVVVGLLILTNIFIFLAWYGHLKYKEFKSLENIGIFGTIMITWVLSFFICVFQVPANKIGFRGNGGPFSLLELKVIQEVITLVVFVTFATIFFENETFKLNHAIGLMFLILAVYFIFKK